MKNMFLKNIFSLHFRYEAVTLRGSKRQEFQFDYEKGLHSYSFIVELKMVYKKSWKFCKEMFPINIFYIFAKQ